MSAAIPLLAHAMRDITPCLDAVGTEEFCVNQPFVGWWRRAGTWTKIDLPSVDYLAIEGIAILAGAIRSQDIGPGSPLLGVDLPTGERLQVCLPPSVPSGTASLTIRKPGGEVARVQDGRGRYQHAGWNQVRERVDAKPRKELLALYDDADLFGQDGKAGFLAGCVKAKLNLLLGGAVGSGKTSMSKSLIAEIDMDERIVAIEDSLELEIPQPNHVRLLYGHGKGGVQVHQLMEATMRMRPSRVMVQELRARDAAITYVMEVMSGLPGSITTIHGGSPREVAQRLFALIQDGSMSDDALLSIMEAAIDVIPIFENVGRDYIIRDVWFRDAAAREGKSLRDLVQ